VKFDFTVNGCVLLKMENSDIVVKNNKMVKKPSRRWTAAPYKNMKAAASYPPSPAKLPRVHAYYQLCQNSNILIQKEQLNSKGERCIDIRVFCPLNAVDSMTASTHLSPTKIGIRLSYFQCEKLVELLKALIPPGPHPTPAAYFKTFEMPSSFPTFLLNNGEFVEVVE